MASLPRSPVLFAALLATGCTERVLPPEAAVALLSEGPFAVGDSVALDASASVDPNETPLPLDYHWRFVSTPAGSTSVWTGDALPQGAFSPDLYGDYNVGVIVSNGLLTSAEAVLTVTVDPCGNEIPTIAAVTAEPAAPNTGNVVQLAATIDDADNSDACALGQEHAWRWRIAELPAGSSATLNDPTARKPSFVVDVPGVYEIELTITDDTGLASTAGTLAVEASTCGSASPAVDEVLVTPATAIGGDLVDLAITVSDADNDATCGLAQTLDVSSAFMSRPVGSTAALSPWEGETPSFLADVAGDYVVRTTVVDSDGRASFRDTTVTVGDCGLSAPAVDDAVVNPVRPYTNELVSLDVTVSDLDNGTTCDLGQALDVTTRFESRPSGSMAALSPAEGASPAFLADVPGQYVLRTTVTDDTGRSSARTTLIDVNVCGSGVPLVMDVGVAPVVPATGSLVSLDVTVDDTDNSSTCALGQTLSIWSEIVAAPSGSRAALTPPAGASPGLVPDVAGEYIVRTWVDDGTGRSSFLDTVVSAQPCGLNAPAFSSAVPNLSSPMTGDLVSVTLLGTDPDNSTTCDLGQALTYRSYLVSQPAGSAAALVPSTGSTPAFVTDVPGIYVMRSFVDDGTGMSAWVDTAVTVGSCGNTPPDAQLEFLVPQAVGPAATVNGGGVMVDAPVQLSGVASSDADFISPCNRPGALSYRWEFVSMPAGSRASFNDTSLLEPSFIPDVPGVYSGRMIVDDGRYTDVATWTITAIPGNIATVANGYSIDFVAGGTGLWNQPKGIAIGPSGQIYVAQSGNDSVTSTNPTTGATSGFAAGGELAARGGLEDIVYAPSVGMWFVSTSNRVVRIDSGSIQSSFYSTGNPRSLTVFTPSGSTTPRLQVASDANDRIEFVSLTTGGALGNTGAFNNIGNLYGHDAAVVSSTNVYFFTDRGQGEVRRWTSTTDFLLTNLFNGPRDIVRAPSGALYVADASDGILYRVSDCVANGCSVLVVAMGPWEPWGLALESNTSLLVTDRNGDALYRLKNPAGL